MDARPTKAIYLTKLVSASMNLIENILLAWKYIKKKFKHRSEIDRHLLEGAFKTIISRCLLIAPNRAILLIPRFYGNVDSFGGAKMWLVGILIRWIPLLFVHEDFPNQRNELLRPTRYLRPVFVWFVVVVIITPEIVPVYWLHPCYDIFNFLCNII